MSRVWKKSQFRGSDLLCLLALADWANDDGWTWYGIDRIAQKIRLERRSTIYVFDKLAKGMELVIHKNVGPAATNLYWVAVGVQSFSPPPAILGLTVVEAPTYRGSTVVRGAKFSRGISPNTSLNVIDEGGDKKEGESVASEDSVQPIAPPMQAFAPHEVEEYLRAQRVSKKIRGKILKHPELELPYIEKWFVYAELRKSQPGLAIVNILDNLPEPEFCDFCAGTDGEHKSVGDGWGDPCPRSNNGKLTAKECEEMAGVPRKVALLGVE